jgi:hypothetical protein
MIDDFLTHLEITLGTDVDIQFLQQRDPPVGQTGGGETVTFERPV